jgi:hypothetical protein
MSGVLNFTSICAQRKQQMLFNTPLSRFNPISPYPQFTQDQLDMRRKAEILKYSSSSSSSQTNNLTRKEKWAKISNAKYNGNTLFCPGDLSLPTLSSSCDVPGPITILQNISSVPLYNYATRTNSFASDNSTTATNYDYILNDNIKLRSNNETSLALLNIKNNQNTNIHDFSIQTPICFYISGSNISPTGSLDLQILINSMSVINYYGGGVSLAINGSPKYSYTTIAIPINLTLVPPNNIDLFSFSAFVYGGMLNLSNINLYTQPGFVYDIRLSFNPNISSSNKLNTSITNNTTVAIYSNITSDVYTNVITQGGRPFGNKNPFNCVINRGISSDSYLPASISSNYE